VVAGGALALVELAVAILVGELIGYPLMLVALVAVSFAGLWVVKVQGTSSLARVSTTLARGRLPGRPLLDGALTLGAGILLLVPGFLTDLVAVALLVPVVRAIVRNVVLARLARRIRRRPIRIG